MRFHSDNTSSDLGFQLHYSAEERLPGCGGVYTSQEGSISTPILPVDNVQAVSCDYEIRLAVGETILIEFQRFELAGDACIEIYDLLEATDAQPARAALQSKNCGYGDGSVQLPPSISSLGNRVRVRYYDTIAGGASNHFKLNYRMDCSRTLTAANGSFSSPGYPNLTRSDRLCTYKINTAPGTIIHLKLMDFQLSSRSTDDDYDEESSGEWFLDLPPAGSNCALGARLTINDGLNHALLGPFCGARKPPQQYVSKTNMLTLQLTASGNVVGRGFRFEYLTVAAPTDACGGVHNQEGQNIRLPLAADNGRYANDMNCEWVIMAPAGKSILLHWLSFDLEGTNDCRFDYVEIRDELPAGSGNTMQTRNPLHRYCGSALPEDMTTQSRMVTVKFVSDFSDGGQGFELSYRFVDRNVCGGKLHASTGMLDSPGYPLPYAGDLDCVWTVNVPAGEQIELQVEMFQLRASPNCSGDWLEVHNGGSNESALVGRFCGDTIPRRIPSYSHQLYLHLHTESVGTGRGFRFAWHIFASGCGGRLVGNAGVITSPNYPQNYPNSAHCEWLLRGHAGSRLRIQLEDVRLEELYSCSFDYVQLEAVKGASVHEQPSNPLFCSLPDNPENRIIYLDSNEARIVFHTDSSETNRGFRLSYVVDCQRELWDMHGIVESLNYGEMSFDQETVNCSWRIRSPRGNHILLEFSHFDQSHEQDEGNPDEGVYLFEGNTTTGNAVAKRILGLGAYNSSGDFITIVHNSSKVSFRLEYRIEGCLYELRGDTGSFNSLNYPNMYPNDVECLWLIHASEGHVIELTIVDMDIQDSVNCTKDALIVSYLNIGHRT